MRLSDAALGAATVAALSCNMSSRQRQDVRSGVQIGDPVSCPTCFVGLDTVGGLRGAVTGPASTIAYASPDLVYLVDRGDGLLKGYGFDGRFVRQIGRKGGGPGEYERIRNVFVGKDGSIQVLDGTLGRLSRFAADGALVGSTSVPVVGGAGWSAVVLPGGELVVNNTGASTAQTGYALTVIDKQGRVLHQIDRTALSSARDWWQYERLLWGRPNGELLAAHPYTFEIDVYSRGLTLKRSFRRVGESIPSHPPESEPSDGIFDKPATPQLRMMWEDSQGRLWLGLVVPSPSWKPGPSPGQAARPPNRDTMLTLAARPRFDTIIEVVDLEGLRVIARSRFAGSVGAPFGGGYLALSGHDSAGEPSVLIYRPHLKQ